MTFEEFETQRALGTLPTKYLLAFLRGTPVVEKCKKGRTCSMCGEHINKDEEFYKAHIGYHWLLNIHIDCGYISFVNMMKMELKEKQ